MAIRPVDSIEFQSTLPQGERLIDFSGYTKSQIISIHAPARGATAAEAAATRLLQHFNPRSRKGSDVLSCPFNGIHDISIHAPARGATAHFFRLEHHHNISIHAPARGATCTGLPGLQLKKFQSTLPQGERQHGMSSPSFAKLFQSTLPQGERRWQQCRPGCDYRHFNPRSRKGSDS